MPLRRPHPIVEQLRFTRSEWLRALAGVKPSDATVHHGAMNSIGWIVGHLAWQEERYLLLRPQKIKLRQDIQQAFTTGGPMSTPALKDTLTAWKQITRASRRLSEGLVRNAGSGVGLTPRGSLNTRRRQVLRSGR